jgi:threonine/homoserine/homoserine lactone efflux protein
MNALTLLEIAAGAFGVGFSGAMMPGPLLAFTVDAAVRRGARAGPLVVLGHALLEAPLVVLLALGFGRALRAGPGMATVAFVGGGVLLWMGIGMLRQAPRQTLAAVRASGSGLHPVAGGAVVSLSNPYWTVWWLTVGASYVMLSVTHGPAGVLAFYVGHILSDLVWYSFVSGAIARGRRIMGDRGYRALMAACGVLLVGFAAWFLWSGARFLCHGMPG